MSQNAEAEDYEEEHSHPNWFQRMKERIMGHDDNEDEEDAAPEPQPRAASTPSAARASGGSAQPLRRGTTLHLDAATRRTHVTVRRAVHSIEDASRAADGLKGGQQQIVNLEQTPADMTERIINFLNGATYALDGSVEKIGDQVYLFTPASVVIDIEDKPVASSGGARAFPTFDRG